MAKTEVIVLSLLFVIALSFTVVNGDGVTRETGGKTPIDVMTKQVQDLGRFAVEEYNKRSIIRFGWTPLVFSKVVAGQTQVTEGATYYLTLEATENGVPRTYEAEVLVKSWENPPKSLLSFTPLLN